MEILETEKFKKDLDFIVRYIARDKRVAAIDFAKKLKRSINELTTFPYKYRQSYYYDDQNIRDMTFKGYTIIYRVDNKNSLIEILEIFNRNLPSTC
jgi:plasmid stabilization system protein ParE